MDHVIALRQINVTAQCYSSILFRRQQENPSSRREGTSIQRHEEKSAPARRRERERAGFGSSVCMFLSPWAVLCKLGQPGVVLVLPEVLTPVLGPSFVLFSRAFSFLVFQPPPFWTPFPYSTYLTFPPQEMRGPILWEQGHQGLSVYFLLNWDGEGHWASPSRQSQASESLQRCPSKGV